jgi:hypothetical protein
MPEGFFLGTHHPHWLASAGVPLFVSRRRLARRKTLPVAVGPWALDSGAFTELSLHGRWTIGPAEYASEVCRYREDIGQFRWAAIQDYMCEPFILAQTGGTVPGHQGRTIQSYLDLTALAPEVPWAPVLQGWRLEDYLDHADAYRAAGIDLHAVPVVGVGSICRRQATREVVEILAALSRLGLELHAFGLKTAGLRRCSAFLTSADSMAWSFEARRRRRPLDGCTHRSCANCLRYALLWRKHVLTKIGTPCQGWLCF